MSTFRKATTPSHLPKQRANLFSLPKAAKDKIYLYLFDRVTVETTDVGTEMVKPTIGNRSGFVRKTKTRHYSHYAILLVCRTTYAEGIEQYYENSTFVSDSRMYNPNNKRDLALPRYHHLQHALFHNVRHLILKGEFEGLLLDDIVHRVYGFRALQYITYIPPNQIFKCDRFAYDNLLERYVRDQISMLHKVRWLAERLPQIHHHIEGCAKSYAENPPRWDRNAFYVSWRSQTYSFDVRTQELIIDRSLLVEGSSTNGPPSCREHTRFVEDFLRKQDRRASSKLEWRKW